MSYLSRNRSSFRRSRTANLPRSQAYRKENIRSPTSVAYRHEFGGNIGTISALGTYETVKIATFLRDNPAGGLVRGAPTGSNNYATDDVFNGSLIEDLTARITVRSETIQPTLVDFYEIQCSFWDALIADTIKGALCPIEMDVAAPGTADNRGVVNFKVSPITWTYNNWKNSNILQHIIKLKARVPLGTNNGASMPATVAIDGIPSKCKRSQNGMFFAYMMFLDSDLNSAVSSPVLRFHTDISFREIPGAFQGIWDG